MLLLLDSYEHLLEGAGLVSEVLKTAPEVKVLVTSRARLNVGGEHRFPVAGMDYPDPETLAPGSDAAIRYDAVQLFLQGAHRAKPGFDLTGSNLRGVLRICRLVEGMPLAIRLAAPWVAMLSPEEIATELTHSLDLLATDRRDVPLRQRSVRATLDYTWRLLTEHQRGLMQGLSIFRGGFTQEAARAVAGATLRDLMALVEKSLLHRAPAPLGALRTRGRYEIHELLRQYAEEKLDQAPSALTGARDRHCAHYCRALAGWCADLKGPRHKTAIAEMRADQENARAAWEWAVATRRVDRVDQALEGLCRFYDSRGSFQEGEAALRVAADKLSATPSRDMPMVDEAEASGPIDAEGLRTRAES